MARAERVKAAPAEAAAASGLTRAAIFGDP
jgi:hypothetical protein